MLGGLKRTVVGWLEHPRLGLHLGVLAVACSLPAFWLGWQLDDHTFRFVLLGQGEGGMTPFRVFTLLGGDPAVNADLIDQGYLPWWTAEGFRIAFFRYLTVLTMWLDYQLWPESSMLMHAHSLLWFAALAVVVVIFYRQVMGPSAVAGLAALLYVLDDARAVPAVWLANRNALDGHGVRRAVPLGSRSLAPTRVAAGRHARSALAGAVAGLR